MTAWPQQKARGRSESADVRGFFNLHAWKDNRQRSRLHKVGSSPGVCSREGFQRETPMLNVTEPAWNEDLANLED